MVILNQYLTEIDFDLKFINKTLKSKIKTKVGVIIIKPSTFDKIQDNIMCLYEGITDQMKCANYNNSFTPDSGMSTIRW